METIDAVTRPAVIYTRVSTGRQVRDGVSLGMQLAKARGWCARESLSVVDECVDHISGAKCETRAGLTMALDRVCGERGVLVVYSLSRLARSTRDTLEIAERLSDAGADMVSLTERIDTTSASGRMVFRMLAVLAEFERDVTRERTRDALGRKRERGERVSRWARYGTRLEGDMVVECAGEVAMVERAKQLRASGLTLARVAEVMEGEGMVSRVGRRLSGKVVWGMVGGVSDHGEGC